jgi:hypothetical protein
MALSHPLPDDLVELIAEIPGQHRNREPCRRLAGVTVATPASPRGIPKGCGCPEPAALGGLLRALFMTSVVRNDGLRRSPGVLLEPVSKGET